MFVIKHLILIIVLIVAGAVLAGAYWFLGNVVSDYNINFLLSWKQCFIGLVIFIYGMDLIIYFTIPYGAWAWKLGMRSAARDSSILNTWEEDIKELKY